MSAVISNLGEAIIADAANGKTAATAWTLRLFSNNLTLSGAMVAANFTEVSGGGYSAFALTAASWVTTAGAPTSSYYPHHTFTFTGATTAPGTIYGYYVTNAAGVVLFAERLPAGPFVPASLGEYVDVTPTITYASVFGD